MGSIPVGTTKKLPWPVGWGFFVFRRKEEFSKKEGRENRWVPLVMCDLRFSCGKRRMVRIGIAQRRWHIFVHFLILLP